ncbi:MAG: AMP-binding protein, partial [Myxococcota bacterium]
MLHLYLDEAAERRPDHPAIVEPDGASLCYRELRELADRTRDRLQALGVTRGDRVGICIHKSIDTVASILGTLRTGAAYVPVDPTAPASRNGFILGDCGVQALIVEEDLSDDLCREVENHGAHPASLVVGSPGGGAGLERALSEADRETPAPAGETVRNDPDDLAYILYTSGSTGKPKGVMLSHGNAVSFVEWGGKALDLRPEDRFSSHAPFHFDLSIFDLYEPLRAAATLVLVTEAVGKEPQKLAALIAEMGITVWYSAPSILTFLCQYGKLEKYDYRDLRTVLFAGEVFPVKHLRELQAEWPHPRYFNLYGPTETNVCTWYEVPGRVPEDRNQPYPIGKVCSHLEGVVIDSEGREA